MAVTTPVREMVTPVASPGMVMPGMTLKPCCVTSAPWSEIWKVPSRVKPTAPFGSCTWKKPSPSMAIGLAKKSKVTVRGFEPSGGVAA